MIFMRKRNCTVLASLVILLLTGCINTDKGGPVQWEISGEISPQGDAVLNIPGGKLMVGAFSYNSPQYTPVLENIPANGGATAVNADSTFKLIVNTKTITTRYLHVFVWLDVDSDGLLDAESEPFVQPLEQVAFGGTLFAYIYDDIEESWLVVYDQSPAGKIGGLQLIVYRSLAGSRVAWDLEGTILAGEGYILDLTGEKLKIGAFPGTAQKLVPELNDMVPEAGSAPVTKNGGFNLPLNVSKITKPYIHIYLWHDANSDGQLDALTERNAPVQVPSLSESSYLAYGHNTQTKTWISLISQKEATQQSGLKLTVNANIKTLLNFWTIKGRVAPASPYEIAFESGKIRVGAFHYRSTVFVPQEDNMEPLAGVTGAGADSSFSLQLEPDSIGDDYIHLAVWYDSDMDSLLDAISEPFGLLQIPSLSGGLFVNYRYSISTREWINQYDLKPAEDLEDLALLAGTNLLSSRHAWSVSGFIRPATGFEFDLENSMLKMGSFPHSGSIYNPEDDDISPQSGVATVKADSSVRLSVDAVFLNADYLHLFFWYDSDGDNMLDASNEPWTRPILSSSTESAFLFYTWSANRGEWRMGNTARAVRDTAGLELLAKRNLIPFRDTWVVHGTLAPWAGQLVDVSAQHVLIGAFTHGQSSYTPVVDNLSPAAGLASVADDSTYRLTITADRSAGEYIHIFTWYDRDGDQKLDALREPWHTPGVIYNNIQATLSYAFYPSTGEWISNHEKKLPPSESGISLYAMGNLIPLRGVWAISGTIQATINESLAVESDSILVGAFSYPRATYTATLENTLPDAGFTRVKPDSTFTLNINTNNAADEYIHVLIWYDSDGDSALDAVSENFDMPIERSLFKGNRITYHYDSKTLQWVVHFDGTVAGDFTGARTFADHDLTKK